MRSAASGAPVHVMAAAGLLLAVVGSSLVYGVVGGEGYNATRLLQRMSPPDPLSFTPFGTDQLGRDVLLRCLKGTQISVLVAVAGVVGGGLIGTLVGLASGYFGGWIDRVLTTLVDTQLAIPNLLIILAGIALLGTSTIVLVAMISVARWEGYARLVRGMVLSAREREYVEAVRALGGGHLRILRLHILPAILSPLVVMVTLNFPAVLLLEASLSFLGIGVQPPTPSLGRMVSEGRDFLAVAPWVSLAPAGVVVAIALSGQIVGDWLRDMRDMRAA